MTRAPTTKDACYKVGDRLFIAYGFDEYEVTVNKVMNDLRGGQRIRVRFGPWFWPQRGLWLKADQHVIGRIEP